MKKVKCIRNDEFPDRLTIGKIYDVLEYTYSIDDCVYVINDLGMKDCFYMHIITSYSFKVEIGEAVFIDGTPEYRNELIDEILI